MAATGINGGEKLMATLKKLAEAKGVVKAGIPEGATNQNGVSIPMYAAMNEFGGRIAVTPKMRGFLGATKGIHLRKGKQYIDIPSRPFLRQTVEKQRKQWVEDLGKLLTAGRSVADALEIMGGRMAENIRAEVKAGNFVPNRWPKPSGNPPLYDSGDMVASIDYEVVL